MKTTKEQLLKENKVLQIKVSQLEQVQLENAKLKAIINDLVKQCGKLTTDLIVASTNLKLNSKE